MSIFGQQFTANDYVVQHGLPRRKQRDDASRAFNQLKVGDQITHLFDRLARKQVVALDHDEDVEFVRRKATRHFVERPELGCLGPLAARLEAGDAFRSRMPFIKLQAMLRMGARESRPEYVGPSCQVASGLRRHDEIALEPVARQTRHFIQRSRFFKQMCRCRHNRQLLFAAQLRESRPI